AGTVALPNGEGVNIFSAASKNTIGGTVMSGTVNLSRNLISGNTRDGIRIYDTETSANLVQGNYIGLSFDPLGNLIALPNGFGVTIIGGATGNEIGAKFVPGTTLVPGRNYISGNTNYGVGLYDTHTSLNMIDGNYIGTDLAGTAALPNGTGVSL